MDRTLAAGTVKKTGKKIALLGWANAVRSHGKVVFVDLRDRSGIVQCVYVGKVDLEREDVIMVEGTVKERPVRMINSELETGTIEIEVEKISVISKASVLPIPIDTEGYDVDEEQRMKYRYLDLRRERMSRNIRLRSKMTTFIRNHLTGLDFVEIETPMLTKTTPEGARDFIVPSRLQKGKFYALPQSPQQYKQLLMVAGFERYFQIVRCFRDEDPRKDRAYGEFTQLDMEISFTSQEEILSIIEKMFTEMVKNLFPEKRITSSPWPKLSHSEVMEKYGTDKPDLRKDKKDRDELAFSWTIDFPLFNRQTKEDFFYGSGKARFAPSHHMFTSPHPDDVRLLDENPMKVRGLQHDLILNGFEVGGGSIRIHDPVIQEKVFDLIGFTEKQKRQFSHMLTAFKYGVPPHGGIAPGIDRLLMAILGEPSVREVMAFPTSSSGQTSVMDAPSEANNEQLKELGVSLVRVNRGEEVFSILKKLLNAKKCKYKVIEHNETYTSEESAKARGTGLHQGAKAILVQSESKVIMVVVPSDLTVNFYKLENYTHYKGLKLSSPDTVTEITKGLKIGAVPPFGSLFGLETYVDNKLLDNSEIAFNAGMHSISIIIHPQDYKEIFNPKIGDFSES